MFHSHDMNLFNKISLIFFLIIIGVTSSFAGDLKLIKEKSFQVRDWENVYVNASGADVKVESWDKQEVYVKIFCNSRAAEKMTFNIDQSDKVVKVIAKKKGSFLNWFWGNISVRIEIMTPKNYNAHVETSGGDISVANITGGFKLDTSGGDVKLNNTNGKLSVETSGGDINVTKHKGETTLSTSGGDIICNGVIGDLHAETSGGDVSVDVNDGKVFAETSGGDITIAYTGLNKGIEAETSGGDIHAKLPSNFAAKVHLETSGGDVSCNFSNSKSNHVSHGTLDADFNGGGAPLKLETTGGDVVVDQK